MTPDPPRATPRPRTLETAVREQLRATAAHRFCSPHVTPVVRVLLEVEAERAG